MDRKALFLKVSFIMKYLQAHFAKDQLDRIKGQQRQLNQNERIKCHHNFIIYPDTKT